MPLTSNEAQIATALTAQATADKAIKESKPIPKKCDIKQVLPASVAQLVEQFPTNDTVRSVVCAHIKVPLPVECQTFKQIRDWIEANIEAAKAEPVKKEIAIPLVGSDTAFGCCDYTSNRSGRGQYPLKQEALLELIATSDDYEGLMDSLHDKIGRDGGIGFVSLSDDGEPSYDNHETNETDDVEWDFNRREIDRVLPRAIRELNPQKADEWGI